MINAYIMMVFDYILIYIYNDYIWIMFGLLGLYWDYYGHIIDDDGPFFIT